MSRQIALFLTAVQFLTRVPVPALGGFQPDWTARSARYFPLVGGMVGLVSAVVFVAASMVWIGPIPALLATTAGIVITGAFHEDGLADAADGLGGGQTREGRLEIMKDSRVGTFGILALGLGIGLKVAALAQMPVVVAVPLIVAAHAGGRSAAVVVMCLLPYAGDTEHAKVKPVADGVTTREVAVALTFGALAIAAAIWIEPVGTGVALAVGGSLAAGTALLARRLIGGWVGDTLGACEQVFEIGFLVVVVAFVAA